MVYHLAEHVNAVGNNHIPLIKRRSLNKKTKVRVDAQCILDFLKQPSYVPLRKNELFGKLGLPEAQHSSFKRTLKDMLAGGQIVKVRKNRYAIASTIGLVVGTFRAHEKGFGFVVPDNPECADVFIPPHETSTAMHLDKVLVRLDDPATQRDPSKGPSGKIVRIQERTNATVVGTVAASKDFSYVIPDDPRLMQNVYVNKELLKNAKLNDRVVVRITAWPSKHVNPEGMIEEVLGPNSDPKIDLIAVLKKYHYETQFPARVLEDAHAIPQSIRPEWLEGRHDLRNQVVFTIDPEDAKDFDDAVSLEAVKGGYLLGVHIADVSFYVKDQTAMDKEARGRATSVYLPGCVIPMLPERLSNGVCSLQEAQDRMTKTVLFHCTSKGEIQKVEIFPSVIRSVKRFTYGEVLKIISEKQPVVSPEIKPLVPMLQEMGMLAKQFHQVRVRRGSIMLNIPKVKVVLDAAYRATGVRREIQDDAHGLIEEFMLLANEAVARHIMNMGRPGIYRVHEPPDRQSFEEFAVFVRSLGYTIHTQDISVHEIQNLLTRIQDKPEAPIIHLHLLRAMKLAVYSNRNLGHFALALKFYTHFTSPIRRYPDLIVHRILDQMWAQKKSVSGASDKSLSGQDIGVMAAHSSKMERMADEAERELSGVKILQFLSGLAQHHSRRVYSGLVTGIKSFGFFVEMEETLVEGVVHLSSLRDDFYDVDIARQAVTGRRRHQKFRLGQRVDVRIEKVDLAKRQVDLVIA